MNTSPSKNSNINSLSYKKLDSSTTKLTPLESLIFFEVTMARKNINGCDTKMYSISTLYLVQKART